MLQNQHLWLINCPSLQNNLSLFQVFWNRSISQTFSDNHHLLRSAVLLPVRETFLSSSSLSDPPEELLSDTTRGACFVSAAGEVPGESLASADTHKKVCRLIHWLLWFQSIFLRLEPAATMMNENLHRQWSSFISLDAGYSHYLTAKLTSFILLLSFLVTLSYSTFFLSAPMRTPATQ